MFDFIGDFLREEGFKPQEIEGRKALVFGFLTDDFRWRVVADANEQDGILTFLSLIPIAIPPARRTAVAELMMRINYTLAVGHFELDFDDGEARFRTAIDLDGTEPTHQLVRQLLRANLQAMGAFLEELQAVAGTEGDDGP